MGLACMLHHDRANLNGLSRNRYRVIRQLTPLSTTASQGDIPSSSYRRASVGGSFAARLAGRYPKITPVMHETTKAATIEMPEIGIVRPSGMNGRMMKGILVAINTPTSAPPALSITASSRN